MAARKVPGCAGRCREVLLSFPRLCNHCADSALHAGVARWARPLSSPMVSCCIDPNTACGLRLLRAGLPLTAAATCLRKRKSRISARFCYHRITKGLTTACCEACPTGARQFGGFEESNDPIHEFLKTHSCAGVEAADGHRREGVHQRSWHGSVR